MPLSLGQKRLVSSLPVALCVGGITGFAGTEFGIASLLIAAIAGLGQWIVFPLLGKRPGFLGYALDFLTCFGGLIVAGLIAGTLLAAPGWGTILGARAAASLPFQSILNAILFLTAFAATSHLARR